MSDSLRRIFNSIDQHFDLGSIKQEMKSSRELPASTSPVTARQAFQSVQPVIRGLDGQFQLKRITSQHGLTPNGTSAHWEFFFNLVSRQAEAACEWLLLWDETRDDYGHARIELVVTPFPALNSPIRTAVKEGKLLHRQMAGLWLQECRRHPALPIQFRDTDSALTDFIRQGLDVTTSEWSLTTGQSPQGRLSWLAQTRASTYYSPFA